MSHSRRTGGLLALLVTLLSSACNPVFDIHEGQPRPQCDDPAELLIDDMEDGVYDICPLSGRHGGWYTVGDGTSTDLHAGSTATTAGNGDAGAIESSGFSPTVIPGGRGSSRYASRFSGSGFTEWGALMGLAFNTVKLSNQPYDASTTGGVTFWMKSNVAVSVIFLIPETVLPANGGQCDVNADDRNCNSHFAFKITAPSSDWTKYEVPFSALTQQYGGSATWNPQQLLGLQFQVGPGSAFDVWIDDLSFYRCALGDCRPTCTDPALPVACPALAGNPAACRPPDTECGDAKNWCGVASLIDDMEDGDRSVCASGGRDGHWYTAGDGSSTTFSPSGSFTQTVIPGGRGPSLYAARLSGSGFSEWGALMGFAFKNDGQPYDASQNGGIRFWLKSSVSVSVAVSTPETTPVDQVASGVCASEGNCNNDFSFDISQPSPDQWVQYQVPFTALAQRAYRYDANFNALPGSATWDPSRLLQVKFFSAAGFQLQTPGAAFETWVDDVEFYSCSAASCLPTCPDSRAPVACPASAAGPAACWIAGTDCSQLIEGFFTSVWGSGPEDVWVVGQNFDGRGIMRHWDGSGWSSVERDTAVPLFSVFGSAPDRAWAIGDYGSVVLWDGATWHAMNTGTQASLNAVWGSGPSDLWAVANPSVLLHFDGATWATSSAGSDKSLWAVWGSSAEDVWAAGDGGTLMHFAGSKWEPTESGTDVTLNGLWGSGPSDVWAVGDKGTILHFDGADWSAVLQDADVFLHAVWGSGPSDVWAVGDKGTTLHFDGADWTSVMQPAPVFLGGVWGSGRKDVWAVGDAGTIIHWNGRAWSVVPNGGTDRRP